MATYGLPQRDIFEFLAFALTPELDEINLYKILKHHHKLTQEYNSDLYSWDDYISDLNLAGKAFLVSRVNFYLAGSTLVNYSFIERVFKTSFSILDKISIPDFAKELPALSK